MGHSTAISRDETMPLPERLDDYVSVDNPVRVREQCTQGKYRKLKISEYREVIAKVAARMAAEPQKYGQRKALAEHPFATMKSIWGYGEFLLRGKEVLRYQKPQLDPEGKVESAEALIAAGSPTQLSFGYIALQAGGQPVWFRNIELKSLEG